MNSTSLWTSPFLFWLFSKCFIVNFLPLLRTRLVLLELPRFLFFLSFFSSISRCRSQAIMNLVPRGCDRKLLPYPKTCLGTAVTAQSLEMYIIQTCLVEHVYSVKKQNPTCVWVISSVPAPAVSDHFQLRFVPHLPVISCAHAESYVKDVFMISWLLSPSMNHTVLLIASGNLPSLMCFGWKENTDNGWIMVRFTLFSLDHGNLI